jgi:membrane associated rhomboid family serine protease
MGPVRYLIFYLLCGIGAGLVHIWFNPASTIPTVGASGAIAGVLGAYLILYPQSRVITLIPIFIFPWIVEIPALLYLGFWFVSQLLNGAAAIASETYQKQAGVAWWAHAGGFVAGMILVAVLARRKVPRRRVFADEYAPW